MYTEVMYQSSGHKSVGAECLIVHVYTVLWLPHYALSGPITLSIFPTISLPHSTSSTPSYLLPLTSIYHFSLSSPVTLLQATPPPLPPRLPPSTPSSQPVPHQACHVLYRTSLQRPLFPPYHICLSSFLSSSLASCDCFPLVSLVHWCAPLSGFPGSTH